MDYMKEISASAIASLYTIKDIAERHGVGLADAGADSIALLRNNIDLVLALKGENQKQEEPRVVNSPLSPVEEDYTDEYCVYIPGYSGYSITRDGDVISPRGRVLSPHRTGFKSMAVNIVRDDGARMPVRVDKLMAMAFGGMKHRDLLNRPIVHKDGDFRNNSLYNLDWSGAK